MDFITILKGALACVLSGVVLYGIGAFVSASFDISAWSVEGRLMLSMLWVAASIALSALFTLPRWP